MPQSLPDLPDIERECRQLQLATAASELHGAVCGWLAGGGEIAPDWLARVLVDDALAAVGPDTALGRLWAVSVTQIQDRSFGFALLLPDDDASIAERSGALFDWCRGFLGAFGLAAGAEPPLSDESREALADIAKLAASGPQEDGDQDDEEALSEIEEFVRVAVLLLHGDCAMGPEHRGRLN